MRLTTEWTKPLACSSTSLIARVTWKFFRFTEIGRASGNGRCFCDVSWMKKAEKAGDSGSERSIKADVTGLISSVAINAIDKIVKKRIGQS